jgi:hypothetical protein
VNGWDFWAIEGQGGKVTLATLRARYVDSRSEAPPQDPP